MRDNDLNRCANGPGAPKGRLRLAATVVTLGITAAAVGVVGWLAPVCSAFAQTTVPTTTTPTTAPPTTTTTTSPPTTTTTTLPPTTTTTTLPSTTTTATTTTTLPTTTTTHPVPHSTTSVPAWVWLVIALAVLVAIGVITAVLIAQRRRAAASKLSGEVGGAVEQIDTLALHLGSADPAAMSSLAVRDAPRLATLIAQVRELEARLPEGPQRDELIRLISAAEGLHRTLMSVQFPGSQIAPSEVQRWAAQVNAAAATARAGLRRTPQ